MRFADVATFVSAGLDALDYDPVPVVLPGPDSDVALQKTAPGRVVFLMFGSGAAMTVESVFDRPFVRVRSIGVQGDFTDSETLAYDLDTLFLRPTGRFVVGSAPALPFVRAGGAPQLLERDTADRYHHICTYVAETPSGL